MCPNIQVLKAALCDVTKTDTSARFVIASLSEVLTPPSETKATHCVLLLLAGSTVQGVCPTRIMWVLELMAGLSGDWNSQPHTDSSVWPSGGAVGGKNCVK